MSVDVVLPALPLLLLAAFVAGALNAVAGGGSFLTLPALVAAGLPAISANATGTVALLPGYVSGAWAFRHDAAPVGGLPLPIALAVSVLGGAGGALLLLLTPDTTFRALVPWLLLAGTLLFALAPYLTRARGAGATLSRSRTALGLLAVSVYGGYFNGGLGILLLALFALIGGASMNAMNGLKNWVSAALTAIAVVFYAAGGLVNWPIAAAMMVAATLGGYGGGRLARRVPVRWLRGFVVGVGLVMTALFFRK
jgi:uncharacterized protein